MATINRIIDRDDEDRQIANVLRDQDIGANEYYASLLNEIRHGLVLDFIYNETAGKYIDFDAERDHDIVARVVHDIASGDSDAAGLVIDAFNEVWSD